MQERIHVEGDYIPQQICGWCSKPAVDEVMLEKPRFRYEVKDNIRSKVVAKHAIMAGVCRDHKNILDRQPNAEKPENYRVTSAKEK
jgi:hypothetical protein